MIDIFVIPEQLSHSLEKKMSSLSLSLLSLCPLISLSSSIITCIWLKSCLEIIELVWYKIVDCK